jgi:DNA-binding Xre family transcriptional regulator
MMRKLDYTWKLREVMAAQGMFSTSALRPLLKERDVELSVSQVYRLVTEKPERLSLKVLMALLDILNCSMDDLIQPVATEAKAKKTATGDQVPDKGIGDFRPKPARIFRED